MPLVQVIVILVAVGIILYAADRWLPIEGTIKGIVMFLIVVAAVLLVLQALGVGIGL